VGKNPTGVCFFDTRGESHRPASSSSIGPQASGSVRWPAIVSGAAHPISSPSLMHEGMIAQHHPGRPGVHHERHGFTQAVVDPGGRLGP